MGWKVWVEVRVFFKKLFCLHLNWTNRCEILSGVFLRRSKPWPYGGNIYELACVSCGKVKNFGYLNPELGQFSTPNFPINFDYNTDLIDWRLK